MFNRYCYNLPSKNYFLIGTRLFKNTAVVLSQDYISDSKINLKLIELESNSEDVEESQFEVKTYDTSISIKSNFNPLKKNS